MIGELPRRGVDDWGSGEYGASRGGTKTHRGIDLACYSGTIIKSLVNGLVTKLGYPYSDDTSYRYVQVTESDGFKVRIFYIGPLVEIGDYVHFGDNIGVAQDIAERYTSPDKYMVNHVHLEVKTPEGIYIDPSEYLAGPEVQV